MSENEDFINLNELGKITQASYMQIAWCGDPECGSPHIILFDEDDNVITSFVASKRTVNVINDAIEKGMPEGLPNPRAEVKN